MKGFTLIELLITISVIAVVGMVIVGVIASTLRGSSKATVLADVKQNGDITLSQMARTIRSASAINLTPCGNPSASVQTITVTNLDTSQVTYACTGNTITANGVSLLDTNAVIVVPTTCSIMCTQQSTADYPVVQIQFSLQQKSAAAVAEKNATVPFQTSVILRNLQQ